MIDLHARKERRKQRLRRRLRLKKRIFGTAERPRMVVFRSCKHIYAQIIDDEKGHTLAAASSLSLRDLKATKTQKAYEVGRMLAKIALERGITKVVFDRNIYKYHGRVKALAEGAREGGLNF